MRHQPNPGSTNVSRTTSNLLVPRSWPASGWTQLATVAFVVLAILVPGKVFYYFFTEEVVGAAAGPERQASTQTAGNNPIYLLMWIGLYLWALARIGLQILQSSLHPVILRAAPISVLVLASTIWSVSLPRSALQSVGLVLSAAIAYVISQSLSPRGFILILRRTLIGLMLASFVMMVIAPDLASTPRFDGAWLSDNELRGVFSVKTDAGWLFGFLFMLIFWSRDWKGALWTRVAMGAVTLYAVLLSNSATGIACAITIIAILFLTRLMPDYVSPMLRTIYVGIIVFSLLLPFIDIGPVASLLGRDPELTGRVPIWEAGRQFILARPLLGYGFGGFFATTPDSPAWEFWANNKDTQPAHFHSSAYEMLIACGILGLAAYLHLLWAAFQVFYNTSIDVEERMLIGGMQIFFLIGAAVDYTFMSYNSYVTVMLFYCVFAAGTLYPRAHGPFATAATVVGARASSPVAR